MRNAYKIILGNPTRTDRFIADLDVDWRII
jgi:hypothetical protein